MIKEYPKNRIYAFFPVLLATAELKEKKPLARHSLDKQFIIWKYDENDKTLHKLKFFPVIQLLTHDEALEEVSKEKWFDLKQLENTMKEQEAKRGLK